MSQSEKSVASDAIAGAHHGQLRASLHPVAPSSRQAEIDPWLTYVTSAWLTEIAVRAVTRKREVFERHLPARLGALGLAY